MTKQTQKQKEKEIPISEENKKYSEKLKIAIKKAKDATDEKLIGGTRKSAFEDTQAPRETGQLKKTKDRNLKFEKAKVREGKGS